MGELNDLLRDVNSLVERRSEQLDRWRALALEQPDPISWVNALVDSAGQRLADGGHDRVTVNAARRELDDLRRDLLAAVNQS